MTVTCRDIIRRALRRLSRVAAGQQPSGDDANDAMEVLQALYDELQGIGAFGKLYDITLTDSVATYTAYEQQRINCQNPAGIIVTLPSLITTPPPYWIYGIGVYPNYPADLCGYGNWGPDYGFGWVYQYPRPPFDKSCVVINDLYSDTSVIWIYNANLARWESISALDFGDRAPLSDRSSDGLADALAVRLAAEFVVPIPPMVARGEQRFMYAITHKYDSVRPPAVVSYR